jgi:hypothetical protein
MLFDIREQRIYACPYEGFRVAISAKNQATLADQYEQAVAEDKMVVYVRDNDARRLVSYSMDYKRS